MNQRRREHGVRGCGWGAIVALAVIVAAPAAAWAQVIEDYWYVVEIQGKKCGHMHASTTKDGARFVTKSEMSMSLKRGEAVVPVGLSSEFTETADGKPVRMRSEVKLGTMPTIDEYVFRTDGVEVSHVVAGARTTDKKPLPEGEWLTPVTLGKFIEAKIAAGEKEFSARTIEPTVGLAPARQTMKLIEKTTLDVVGKTVPALKWSAKNEMVPNAESTEYTDERGVSLRSENDIGGMRVVMVRADRAVAMAKADPPELLESTFIRPDRPIKGARESSVGDYLVRCPEAPIGEWPSAGAQTVTKVDEHTVKAHIDVAARIEASKADQDNAAYRNPSAMINSTDVEVVRLTKDAAGERDKDNPAARAERMRSFVHGFIHKKSFDVGFASAAETARTRCGDCSEHAVLLCAMLRADGIASRCVSGIVYVDGPAPGKGFFGYHMWTQALLKKDGKMCWVDLDAALSSTRPMDGTHLAISTLSLADGETVNALLDTLPTLGKLRVEVGAVTK